MPLRIPRASAPSKPTFVSSLSSVYRPPISFACAQSRSYATPQKKTPGANKKRKASTHFKLPDLRDADQFSLVDAMRYIRAFEVGQNPVAAKYELAVRLKTEKSGPTIKSRLRLPKPVKTDMRICVIAEGKQAEAARKAGAVLVGTEDVFEKIRNGELDFDKVVCHDACFQALSKAKLGRILGPKGLMPSPKFGTVVASVQSAMKDLTGKSDYRERAGVIRMAIGQLAFTETELQKNIKFFVEQLKKDFGQISHRADKAIHEVVLSSTNSAGFSLNGEFKNMRGVDA